MNKPWCPDLNVTGILNNAANQAYKNDEAKAAQEMYDRGIVTPPRQDRRLPVAGGVSLKTCLDQVHEKAKEVLKLIRMGMKTRPVFDETEPYNLEKAYSNLGKAVFSLSTLKKMHEVLQTNSTRLFTPMPNEFKPLIECHARQIDLLTQMIYAIHAEEEKKNEVKKSPDQSPPSEGETVSNANG